MSRTPRPLRIAAACTRLALGLTFAVALALPAAGEWDDEEDDSDGAFHSLDSVDTGRTHDLDSVDTGRTRSLDEVDGGRSESLDAVEQRASEHAPAAPAPQPLPPIQNGNWDEQAQAARRVIAAAEARLKAANDAYGNMMERDYPSGDARREIVGERDAAQSGLNEAWAYYGQIKKRAREAGRPL
jgi:hypothetical protein